MRNRFLGIQSPVRRLLITVVINFFYWFSLMVDYPMQIARSYRPRARVHWMGRANRPRRPERAFMVFTFLGAILFLPAEQLLLWSVGWGSVVSMFVIVRSVGMVMQR